MFCLKNHIEALNSNIAGDLYLFIGFENTLLYLCLSTPVQTIQIFPQFYGDLNHKPAIENYDSSIGAIECMPAHRPATPVPFVYLLHLARLSSLQEAYPSEP